MTRLAQHFFSVIQFYLQNHSLPNMFMLLSALIVWHFTVLLCVCCSSGFILCTAGVVLMSHCSFSFSLADHSKTLNPLLWSTIRILHFSITRCCFSVISSMNYSPVCFRRTFLMLYFFFTLYTTVEWRCPWEASHPFLLCFIRYPNVCSVL